MRLVRYRPSNGSEGDAFMAAWCCHCERGVHPCEILALTMALEIDHFRYPPEWVEDLDQPFPFRQPRCTAFRDLQGQPPATPIPDPRQLSLELR